jgi:ABC-type Zn uptake system ZnuABC Zn-binding protein ZnuA
VTTTDHYEGYFALSIDEDGEYSFIQNSVGTYTITHQTDGILKAELSIDSPVDYEVISHADVYDLEPGMYHIHIPTSSFNTLQMVIVAADHEEHAGEDQEEEHHHEDEHHHGSTDPHFWLDPLRAKIQVDNILTGIISADPENATYYTQHATALKERLDGLHTNFTKGLQNRQKNDIITTHEGFNYLAKRYGFTAHAAIGISGDEQPSTQDLAHLIEIMDELDLNYVFVEPIYADEYMTTIARETGASVLVLDGLHGRTGVHATMDYFQIMEENLKHLQTGLEVSN